MVTVCDTQTDRCGFARRNRLSEVRVVRKETIYGIIERDGLYDVGRLTNASENRMGSSQASSGSDIERITHGAR